MCYQLLEPGDLDLTGKTNFDYSFTFGQWQIEW